MLAFTALGRHEVGARADQRQRFINEAAVLARLARPNTVPVYDIGRDAEGLPLAR